ncbi:Protein of unknown function [Gryllus bimaculatus]|nr:Protein of unknown function [Gryllus bimaculatus]
MTESECRTRPLTANRETLNCHRETWWQFCVIVRGMNKPRVGRLLVIDGVMGHKMFAHLLEKNLVNALKFILSSKWDGEKKRGHQLRGLKLRVKWRTPATLKSSARRIDDDLILGYNERWTNGHRINLRRISMAKYYNTHIIQPLDIPGLHIQTCREHHDGDLLSSAAQLKQVEMSPLQEPPVLALARTSI